VTPINNSLLTNAPEISSEEKNCLHIVINSISEEAFSHDLREACKGQGEPESALENWHENIQRIFMPHTLDLSDAPGNSTESFKERKRVLPGLTENQAKKSRDENPALDGFVAQFPSSSIAA
jgi:hypothetical protein